MTMGDQEGVPTKVAAETSLKTKVFFVDALEEISHREVVCQKIQDLIEDKVEGWLIESLFSLNLLFCRQELKFSVVFNFETSCFVVRN